MTLSLLVLLFVVLLAVGSLVIGLDKVRRAGTAAEEALGGISAHLTRKAALGATLVETVRGHGTRDPKFLDEVTREVAEATAAAAGNDAAAMATAGAALEAALAELEVMVGATPDLRVDSACLELQRQLAEVEAQLVFARRRYDDAVGPLDALTRAFPWARLAGLAGVGAREPHGVGVAQDAAPRAGS